jgi:hypothetical protein
MLIHLALDAYNANGDVFHPLAGGLHGQMQRAEEKGTRFAATAVGAFSKVTGSHFRSVHYHPH